MRRLISAAFIATLVFLLAQSVLAKDVIDLDCKSTSTDRNSVLQPEIKLAYDPAKKTVEISDRLIMGENDGKPLEGTVSSDNGTRVDFGWKVKNVRNNTGQVSTLLFKLIWFKATGKFTIQMIPQGYDNVFDDHGVCTQN